VTINKGDLEQVLRHRRDIKQQNYDAEERHFSYHKKELPGGFVNYQTM
jgi:hypothetical protein